jgi:hypothetical protein
MSFESNQRKRLSESRGTVREPDRGERHPSHDEHASGERRAGRRRRFVPTSELQGALRGIGPLDHEQFRADVDAILDQDPTPRFWSGS